MIELNDLAYGVVTIPFSPREKNAREILRQIEAETKFMQVDNPRPRHNSLYNHYFCWKKLLSSGKTYLTLMQDDIILTNNFSQKHLKSLNSLSHDHRIISFFSMATKKSTRAVAEGKSYFRSFGYSDQCATLHCTVVARMLTLFDEILGPTPREYWQELGLTRPKNLGWDSFWNHYCRELDSEYKPIYAIPDLVQHDVDKFDSSIGNPNKGKGLGRISWTFEP